MKKPKGLMSDFHKQLTGKVHNLIGKTEDGFTRAIVGSKKTEGQVRNYLSSSSINITLEFWIIKLCREGSASPGTVFFASPRV